jgi:hypothetical protein
MYGARPGPPIEGGHAVRVLTRIAVAVCTMAAATPGAADCPGPGSGARFCIYTSPSYAGAHWQTGVPAVGTCLNIPAPYNDNGDSYANKTTARWALYESVNCQGLLIVVLAYGDGTEYFDTNMSPYNNVVSSVKRI